MVAGRAATRTAETAGEWPARGADAASPSRAHRITATASAPAAPATPHGPSLLCLSYARLALLLARDGLSLGLISTNVLRSEARHGSRCCSSRAASAADCGSGCGWCGGGGGGRVGGVACCCGGGGAGAGASGCSPAPVHIWQSTGLEACIELTYSGDRMEGFKHRAERFVCWDEALEILDGGVRVCHKASPPRIGCGKVG